MLLELVKMELQLAQNHVKAAQEQLELLESNEPTTLQKKGGGPFHKGQTVLNKDTGKHATVIHFLGNGFVKLQSQHTGRYYRKNYRYLEAL